MIEQFMQVVKEQGNQIAVEDGSLSLSYSELDSISNALASSLANIGVHEGAHVGLCLPRSAELIATMVAVIKLGACYVPIEPSMPVSRRQALFEQCDIRTVLSYSEQIEIWRYEEAEISVAELFDFKAEFSHALSQAKSGELVEFETFTASPDTLACLFFTSGSTGLPKGVSVLNSGIKSVVHQPNYVPLTSGKRVGNFANPSFDALTFEVWGALLNGATTVVFTQEEINDPQALARKIEQSALDVAFMTTGLFNLMVLEFPQSLVHIKHLLVGGEAFVASNAAPFFDAATSAGFEGSDYPALYNVYGPTECTTFSACHRLQPESVEQYIRDARVPIGKGINRTQVYVVVEQNRLALSGEVGEIAISGPALARGYYGDETRSAERFVYLPWLKEHVYLSGDLGMQNEQGDIEFLGRADQQVKVRGHRIELSEIEQCIQSHPDVLHASCVSVKEQETDIYAYLSLHSQVSKETLRQHIRQYLPSYMVPHRFFTISQAPLNKNGKLDKRRLRDMEHVELVSEQSTVQFSDQIDVLAPTVGKQFVSVVREMLKLESSPNQNSRFLENSLVENGGDSLKAMRIIARLRKQLSGSLELSVGDFMASTSLIHLATDIEQQYAALSESESEKNSENWDESRAETHSNVYSASPEQSRLALLQYLNTDSTAYNAPFVFTLTGNVDVEALQKAWIGVVKQHGALRSQFSTSSTGVKVEECEFQDEMGSLRYQLLPEHRVNKAINARVTQRFNIEAAPLFTSDLIKVDGSQQQATYHLVLCFHHLIVDGWSINVLLNDLSRAYEAFTSNQALKVDRKVSKYLHFSQQRQAAITASSYQKHMEFWRSQPLNAVPSLFSSLSLVHKQVEPDGVVKKTFTPKEWSALKSNAQNRGMSLFSALLGVWGLTLNRYFHQDRVAIASPVANREGGNFENLVGMCANTCLFNIEMPIGLEVSKFLNKTHYNVTQVQKHQQVDFADVASIVQQRSVSGVSDDVIESMLVLENTDPSVLTIKGAEINAQTLFSGEAKFPITLFVNDCGDNTELVLEYQGKKISNGAANAMVASFMTLSTHLFQSLDRAIQQVPYLSPSQLAQVAVFSEPQLQEYQSSSPSLPWHRVEDWFAYQASVSPHNIAVEMEGQQLSYQALDAKSEKLAVALRAQYQRAPSETIVGLSFYRGIELVVAVMAILKSGAAYLPLDPDYPKQRLNTMCELANLDLLLTEEGNLHSFVRNSTSNKSEADSISSPVYCLNSSFELKPVTNKESHKESQQSSEHIDATAPPEVIEKQGSDRAYVIYTSGSTGVPKGVEIPHDALLNYLDHCVNHYFEDAQVSAGVVSSSVNFDATVTTLLAPLVAGKTVKLIPQDGNDVHSLASTIKNATEPMVFKLTPTHLKALNHYLRNEQIELAHRFVVGGEAFDTATAKQCQRWLPSAKLINEYGPTEATVGCSTYVYPPQMNQYDDAALPIGHPICGVNLHVLNRHAQLCAQNVIGEIHISGSGVALGYLNQGEKTRERFVHLDINGAIQRCYKTGDFGYWNTNGELIFCGREDDQIKLNGYRIELGDIEAALAFALPNVRSAVALKQSENAMLVAYVELCVKQLANKQQVVMDALAKQLPSHMIPSHFCSVDTLPETPNGKLDRDALPTPDLATKINNGEQEKAHSESPLVNHLISMFSQQNGAQVHPNTPFFESGFNSLNLMKMHSQLLQDEWLCSQFPPINLVDLFAYPSIRKLAEFLMQEEASCGEFESNESNERKGSAQTKEKRKAVNSEIEKSHDIAVIGMAVNLPAASDLSEFWEVIKNGKECIERIPLDKNREKFDEENWVSVRSSMLGVTDFDPAYFGISEHDAKLMDPQQRHALMTAVHALENAGIEEKVGSNGSDMEPHSSLSKDARKIGVFMSASDNTYGPAIAKHGEEKIDPYHLSLLNEKDFIATRIAYHLNLSGPAITAQTACSSSLVAIHQACQQIQLGDCDIALAGGVNADLETLDGYPFRKGMILSEDGHCKPFSNHASGTVPANGTGAVVLKRLDLAKQDGDRIYCVVKGSAVNNDGGNKVSFYAPSVHGQRDVIVQAQRNAQVFSEQVQYVEAHGTGTPLGDPIEVEALSAAFEANRKSPDTNGLCQLGSLKSQMGHLGSAAGVAGFIRTALCLYHQHYPATLWSDSLNEAIDFKAAGFALSTQAYTWEGRNRFAGVSSFGMGGTNAHVILGAFDDVINGDLKWDKLPTTFNTKSYLSPYYANPIQTSELQHTVERIRVPFEQWFLEESWQRVLRVKPVKGVNNQTLFIGKKSEYRDEVIAHYQQQGNQVTYVSNSANLPAWLNIESNEVAQLNVVVFSQSDHSGSGSIQPLWQRVELVQALQSCSSTTDIQVIFLNSNSAEVLGNELVNPDSALMNGLVKTMTIENPSMNGYCLDVSESESSSDLAASLTHLFSSSCASLSQPNEPFFALRHGYLWQQAFVESLIESTELDPLTEQDLSKQSSESNVFIVTGSKGGIGRHLTQHLLAQDSQNVVIGLSRSAKQEHIQQGVREQHIQCDISNGAQWQSLVEQIHQTFGCVKGIIHAAGLAGGAMIHTLNADTLQQNVGAKVLGAIQLAHSIDTLKPEFVLYCSSMSSIYPVAGQTDYNAANAFLNQMSFCRRDSTTRMISVNFPTWLQTGMAKDVNKTDFAITPQEGLMVFDRVIHSLFEGCLYVSPLNQVDARNFFHSLNHRDVRTRNDKNSAEQSGYSKNSIVEDTNNNLDIRLKLTALFAEMLGMEESDIDPDVCFYDLGGDSLTVLDLLDVLNELFPDAFTLVQLNQNVSIDSLTLHLEAGLHLEKNGHLEKNTHLESSDELENSGESEKVRHVDVLIHPVGGDVSGYRKWRECYPKSRELIAIRDPLLEGGASLNTIQMCAQEYCAQLSPHRVKRVIGWSFGAVVAQEMVKQLGDDVELVLIDPPALNHSAQHLPELANSVFVKEVLQQYPELKGRLNEHSSVNDIVDAMHTNGSEARQYLERVVSACQKNANALRQYKPSKIHVKQAWLFVASEHSQSEKIDVTKSWLTILPDINIHEVNGDHYSILCETGSRNMLTMIGESAPH
ncbi:amino acid adenylation domain-containing protein [Vibrio penaeicida]|uniref:non-ribosomal peptide synthetase n=1 Tax=Vibrio penaeicida TaxID=104609 RepID=UPI0027343645|nr:non-ribosomal peptide synthetase [Vibrio penaeicida]MDP2574391.1 amino acid adenylation domain-containing protein [Vibrio penaeicida]